MRDVNLGFSPKATISSEKALIDESSESDDDLRIKSVSSILKQKVATISDRSNYPDRILKF